MYYCCASFIIAAVIGLSILRRSDRVASPSIGSISSSDQYLLAFSWWMLLVWCSLCYRCGSEVHLCQCRSSNVIMPRSPNHLEHGLNELMFFALISMFFCGDGSTRRMSNDISRWPDLGNWFRGRVATQLVPCAAAGVVPLWCRRCDCVAKIIFMIGKHKNESLCAVSRYVPLFHRRDGYVHV